MSLPMFSQRMLMGNWHSLPTWWEATKRRKWEQQSDIRRRPSELLYPITGAWDQDLQKQSTKSTIFWFIATVSSC